MPIDPITGAVLGTVAKEAAKGFLDSNRCPACNGVRWLSGGLCVCNLTVCTSCHRKVKATQVCACAVPGSGVGPDRRARS